MNSNKNNNELTYSLRDDLRWQALQFGLSQLTDRQLLRIIDHVGNGGQMVCDTYNYDASMDSWCPLAIGLGIPEMLAAMGDKPRFTNDSAKIFITEIGRRICPTFTLNPISGVPGAYFRSDRMNDILGLCHYIMAERSSELRNAA